ncbi:hypothetical protein LCGC14_1329050 [marine sediment metagenome]|uniref:Uncharacterized protein n=1 Tax=marine sediment metagenome TaxID=412755 RepID=A0A0F9KHT3_9ZZZZ
MATTPNIYDFIIYPIRLRDQREGKLFLERFLTGPQAIWEATRDKIQDIKTLWSVTDCPDAQLQYLKHIVGWTVALDAITKDLDYATLRKLISFSVAMWKERSTETSISNALNVLVPGRARIWNWFDLRWILDETILGEEHQGRDSYLVSMPDDAYWSNVRIVDNPVGTVDRTLVKELLNLMRPVGERYEIVYLKFLDLFESDGDVSQWDQGTAAALLVEDGHMKLRDPVITEGIWANVEGADTWTNYVVSARVKGLSGGSFGISFYQDELQDLYYVVVAVLDNALILGKFTAGVPSDVVKFDFSTIGYTVQSGVWYLLRVQISPEGATNRIKVYMDGEKYIDTTDSTHGSGTAGLVSATGTMLDCDEIEVLGLPTDSETVEINY